MTSELVGIELKSKIVDKVSEFSKEVKKALIKLNT